RPRSLRPQVLRHHVGHEIADVPFRVRGGRVPVRVADLRDPGVELPDPAPQYLRCIHVCCPPWAPSAIPDWLSLWSDGCTPGGDFGPARGTELGQDVRDVRGDGLRRQ